MSVKSSSFLGAVQAVKNSVQPQQRHLPIGEKANTKPNTNKKLEEKPVKKRVSSRFNKLLRLLTLNI